MKVVKLFWNGLLSVRVVFSDEEEKMIIYDHYKNNVVEKSIGRSPILQCKGCGMFLIILKGQHCNCFKEERFFVDIDDMY